MNVVRSAAERSARNSALTAESKGTHHVVNLYDEFPSVPMSLDDFEENALARLKVLHKFDQLKMRNVPYSRYPEHLDPLLAPLARDTLVDVSSHFILRLAYCRTNELRSWLLSTELALLRYRLGSGQLTKAGNLRSVRALASVVPEAKILKDAEQEQLWSDIVAATPSLCPNGGVPPAVASVKIFRVPFHMALDLVGTRQVLVRKGTAYVPHNKLASLVLAKFRMKLSHELTMLSSLPEARSSSTMGRVANLVENLSSTSSTCMSESELASGSSLNASNIKQHVRHMPLCMVNLQRGLERDGKVKYWGRQQYGLFLKSAGLSMEEALVYFERMFTSTTKFQKEYAYNVRHQYGKEGKRANYQGYSCSKIILNNPPTTAVDHHGCPFKHSSVEHVTDMLKKLGVDGKERSEITVLQKSGDFQLACLKHFESVHPKMSAYGNRVSTDNVGNHPNAWFRASVAYSRQEGTAICGAKGDNKSNSNAMNEEMDTETLLS